VSDANVWKRTFPKGSRRWASSASTPIAVATPDGRVEVLDERTGETISGFSLQKSLTPHSSIRVIRQGEALFAAIEERGNRILERGALNGVESQPIDGGLLALERGGTKPLWETTLKNNRIVGWPLDSLPVIVALESPESRRNGAAATATLRVFEKATGKKLVDTALPSEMQTINDVAIVGRGSRVELSGWTKKLQLYFGDGVKAAEKKPDGPTLDDVGNVLGKLFDQVGKENKSSPKSKK
jgi:hypothetical protein